jgi:hypothetical protein
MEECLGLYSAQAIGVYPCVTEDTLIASPAENSATGKAAVISQRLQIYREAQVRIVTRLATSGRREEAPSDV